MSDRKVAIVPIPCEYIKQKYQFPKDWIIVGCIYDFQTDEIKFQITGDSLSVVNEGEEVPEIRGTITTEQDENGVIKSEKIKWEIKNA